MIIGKVKKQMLQIVADHCVDGSRDYITGKVSFSNDWCGMQKYVHFKLGNKSFSVLLDENGEWGRDAHVNLTAGEWLIWLHGTDGKTVITTNVLPYRVITGGTVNGEPFPEINPSIGEQIVQRATEEANRAADSAQRAERHEWTSAINAGWADERADDAETAAQKAETAADAAAEAARSFDAKHIKTVEISADGNTATFTHEDETKTVFKKIHDIFVAEYKKTTYDEISEAVDAGKEVICYYDNPPRLCYRLLRIEKIGKIASFTAMYNHSEYRLECMNTSWYNYGSSGLENTANKTKTITNNPLLYPTSQAVYEALKKKMDADKQFDYNELLNKPTIPEAYDDAEIREELGTVSEEITKQKTTLTDHGNRIGVLERGGGSGYDDTEIRQEIAGKLSKLHYTLNINKSLPALKSGSLQVYYFMLSDSPNAVCYLKKQPLASGKSITVNMPHVDGVASWRFRVGLYKNDRETTAYDATAYQITYQDSNVITQLDGYGWVIWCAYGYDSSGNPVSFNVLNALTEDIVVVMSDTKDTYIDRDDALDLIRKHSGVDGIALLKDANLISAAYAMDNGSMGNPYNATAVRTAKVEPITHRKIRIIYPYNLGVGYALWSVNVYRPEQIGGAAEQGSSPAYANLLTEARTNGNYIDIDFGNYVGYGFAACIYAKNADGSNITLRSNNGISFYVCNIASVFESQNAVKSVLVTQAQGDAALSILHFSDIHSDKVALTRIKDIADTISYDDAICTGDIVSNDSSELITQWWDSKILTCIGNHDSATYSASTGYNWTALSMAERDARYISPFKANWGVTHTAGKSYYYKDYASKKIRMIVLDAMLYSATAAVGDAEEQNAWLTTLLSDAISKGYHVAIAEHAPHGGAVSVQCNFSRYDAPQTMPTYQDCNLPDSVINIVASAISNGLAFVGYLCGHTHQDNIWDCTGDGTQLMYCVTCAAASSKPQWVNSDQYRGTTSNDFVDAVNLVSIDTATKTVRIVRFGADCDKYMRSRKAICISYASGKVLGYS